MFAVFPEPSSETCVTTTQAYCTIRHFNSEIICSGKDFISKMCFSVKHLPINYEPVYDSIRICCWQLIFLVRNLIVMLKYTFASFHIAQMADDYMFSFYSEVPLCADRPGRKILLTRVLFNCERRCR